MFSSILDTVRVADKKQLTMVEAYLMRSALSGSPAVLSPNQAIDSAAVQAIVIGNGQKRKNHFIRAVEKGIVRISLPNGTRSVLDYCLNTIDRSLKNPNNEFLFSSLKFLYTEEDGRYVYDYAFRKSILDYIHSELSQTHYRNRIKTPFPVNLPLKQREQIDCYIQVVSELDRATQLYDQYIYLKDLYPQIVRRTLADKLQVTPPKTPLAELIVLMLRATEDPVSARYRSYYYRLCKQYTPAFGDQAIREVQEILDICYNKLIAISIKQPAEINIDCDLVETAALQASGNDVSQTMVTTVNRIENTSQMLDWEILIEIYEEVEAICREKGVSWQAALKKYHTRQSTLPFVLGGKYTLITSMSIALSSIPMVGSLINDVAVEIFVDTVRSEIEGEVEGRMGKPSVKEIVQQTKKAQNKLNMMDLIICTNTSNGKDQVHGK